MWIILSRRGHGDLSYVSFFKFIFFLLKNLIFFFIARHKLAESTLLTLLHNSITFVSSRVLRVCFLQKCEFTQGFVMDDDAFHSIHLSSCSGRDETWFVVFRIWAYFASALLWICVVSDGDSVDCGSNSRTNDCDKGSNGVY